VLAILTAALFIVQAPGQDMPLGEQLALAGLEEGRLHEVLDKPDLVDRDMQRALAGAAA
jgi:hypothetical protein